jgi:hypothetical protein
MNVNVNLVYRLKVAPPEAAGFPLPSRNKGHPYCPPQRRPELHLLLDSLQPVDEQRSGTQEEGKRKE